MHKDEARGDAYVVNIKVSVLMTVYNHERYLSKAINGVLMQKTNFRYELIIGEDCSTDNSRKIVEEYQRRYPKIIRAMLNTVNLGMDKNGWQVTESAKGKYLAICEGDDYWIDSNKLQTQVDFLENNPEYSGCYHSVNIVNERDEPCDIGDTPYIFYKDSDFSGEDWVNSVLPGQTGSLVMRNLYPDMKHEDLEKFLTTRCNGDNKIPILLLHYGKIRKMGQVMSCYRRSYTGDSWNALRRKRDMRAYLYKNGLERDRLARQWLGINYLSHDSARGQLQNVLKDVSDGKAVSQDILKEIVIYNPWQFVAFLMVYDIQRISAWEKPLSFDLRLNDDEYTKYVIFGTGVYGEKCYDLLIDIVGKDKVSLFWDNDYKKQGSTLHGVPIEKPKAGISNHWKIFISSPKHMVEMRKQLKILGYANGQIASFTYLINQKINKLFNKR